MKFPDTFSRPFSQFVFRSRLLLLIGLYLGFASTVQGQVATPPRTYEFMTVSTFESSAKSLARILIAPAFQGKSDIQLEEFSLNSLYNTKNQEKFQRNTLVVNQLLESITAAGWELAHVYHFAEHEIEGTRYLFRKAK